MKMIYKIVLLSICSSGVLAAAAQDAGNEIAERAAAVDAALPPIAPIQDAAAADRAAVVALPYSLINAPITPK